MCVRELSVVTKLNPMYVCMFLASCPCLDFGALILIQLSKLNFILLHSKNSGLNLEKIIIFYFYLKKIEKIICMCVREVVSCNKIKLNVCMYVCSWLLALVWCPYFIQRSKFNFILLHSKNSGLNLFIFRCITHVLVMMEKLLKYT